MSSPMVSIFVTSYNHSKYILETLESIRNQTYTNFELILVDDFSKDDSVEIIDNWIEKNNIKCTFIKHKVNIGICKTLNEILKIIKGKYLAGCASDDIWLPNKLEKHVKALEQSDERIILIFSDALLINSEGELYQNRFIAYNKTYLSLKSGNFYNELIEGNFIPAMSVVYKTELLKKFGTWDENLSFEDYDMWLRLAKQYNFLYDAEPTVKYRLHETNLSKTLDSWFRSGFLIYLKHLDNDRINYLCIKSLKDLYKENNKDLRYYSNLYFEKKEPSDFMLKCIKANIPYFFYKRINSVNSRVKRFIK
jgi:glycosyltransferase involved in cell wall biosynthesis